MSTFRRLVAVALAASLLLSGCATGPGTQGQAFTQQSTPDGCHYSVSGGAVAGALLGALLGAAVAGKRDRGKGAMIGLAAGGLVGAGITGYLQQRCQSLRAAQAQMRASQLTFTTVSLPAPTHPGPTQTQDDDKGVAVSAIDLGMFPTGSAELSPSGRNDMQRLAAVFARSDRRVLIVGHTDATGAPEFNQELSEQRALTVARLFAQAGIATNRVYYQGVGDSQPIDSDQTETGRAKNRRVEVVELGSEDSLLAYSNLAAADPEPLATKLADRAADQRAAAAPTTAPAPDHPAKTLPLPSRQGLAALRAGTRFDFGGARVSDTGANLAALVGKPPASWHGLSILNALIPPALADTPKDTALLTTACIADHDVLSPRMKSLATGEPVERRIADYMPGLYGSSWMDQLNGNLVGLANVSVVRDGGQADVAPKAYVFAHYKPGDQKPSLSATGRPRAYVGQKGVLYRVFFAKVAWPLRCIDLVFSRSNAVQTAYGRLYYDKNGEVYGVDFEAKPAVGK